MSAHAHHAHDHPGHGHHHHHNDGHGGHEHGHGPRDGSRAFVIALLLSLGYGCVEAVGGWWTGSLALLGDAGHMFSDGLALLVAAFASWLARRPAGAKHSYGWARAEVVGAFANGLLMVGVVVYIYVEAVQRLINPAPVSGAGVMGIAFIGLLVNAVMAWVLHGGEPDLNRRAALLHVIGDLVSSVAALLAGLLVYLTGWTSADPLISAIIATLILASTVRLLRDTFHVLMEGVPHAMDLNDIGKNLARVEGVSSVHDLHVWSIGSSRPMLSAHLEIAQMTEWPRILADARALLRERYSLEHVTLQPEAIGTPPRLATVRLWPKRPEK